MLQTDIQVFQTGGAEKVPEGGCPDGKSSVTSAKTEPQALTGHIKTYTILPKVLTRTSQIIEFRFTITSMATDV